MRLKQIKENLELAKLYKYVSELEHEKMKRNNGIHHDFSDIDNHYIKEIEKYHKLHEFYKRTYRNKIGTMYNIYGTSFFLLAIIIVLFLYIL